MSSSAETVSLSFVLFPFVPCKTMTPAASFPNCPSQWAPRPWSPLGRRPGELGPEFKLILLDTCTFLWLSEPGGQLPAPVADAIRKCPPSDRYISAISAFEIGYKPAIGNSNSPSRYRVPIKGAHTRPTFSPLRRQHFLGLRGNQAEPDCVPILG